MKNIKETYTEIINILAGTGLTLDDIQLYQEMNYINRVYEMNIDEATILKLHRLTMDYYLKYDGNPSMYTLAEAMLNYYESKSLNIEEFLEEADKWDFFEFIDN
jgi:hypothetical protein